MKIETFNTGRAYTEAGQRIAAAIVPNVNGAEWVFFVDMDRHITGAFERLEFDAGERVTQREVLAVYDNSYTFHIDTPIRDTLGHAAFEQLRADLKAAAAAVPAVDAYARR